MPETCANISIFFFFFFGGGGGQVIGQAGVDFVQEDLISKKKTNFSSHSFFFFSFLFFSFLGGQ